MKNIVVEQENIAKQLCDVVNEYDNLPCRCEYQNLTDKPCSLSLTSLSGAPKIEKEVTGAYTGEFPFALYLRVVPETTAARFDCEQLLNELAAYLEKHFLRIRLDGGREIEEIEQTQTATIINRADNKTVDYQVILMLRYYAKN